MYIYFPSCKLTYITNKYSNICSNDFVIVDVDCDQKFHSDHQKSGTFSSPKYPNAYPVDMTCHFVFQGEGQERVQIMFTDLDLRLPVDMDHLPILSQCV